MRTIWNFLILVVAGATISCATPGSSLSKPNLSKISIGMSKQEVITELGDPHDVA